MILCEKKKNSKSQILANYRSWSYKWSKNLNRKISFWHLKQTQDIMSLLQYCFKIKRNYRAKFQFHYYPRTTKPKCATLLLREKICCAEQKCSGLSLACTSACGATALTGCVRILIFVCFHNIHLYWLAGFKIIDRTFGSGSVTQSRRPWTKNQANLTIDVINSNYWLFDWVSMVTGEMRVSNLYNSAGYLALLDGMQWDL